ncbi:MAG TPA: DUF503 domain-containing protein [Bacillota bacterium]|nr:DUF503 domain-containing protein [Bacillota bacterium]
MIVSLEVELFLYNCHSLKQKRSVIKRLLAKIQKDFNVAVAELAYHDLWNWTTLGFVTIANEYNHAERTIQDILKVIDSFTELECTTTDVERL